jgi:sulfotransferase family protein
MDALESGAAALPTDTIEDTHLAPVTDPIFVRGMSRSGGTLMVTLLDAHSDIAMSYELYPGLVETDADFDLKALAAEIEGARNHKKVAEYAPTKHFSTFVARSLRGGLSYQDFARLLVQLVDEGHTLAELKGRMRLIELCGLEKMNRVGKTRWGMKCDNAFEDYLTVWPEACFLNMLRDGRDVLASQLNTGNFQQSPKEVAKGWQSTIRRFEQLIERPDAKARMVRYEALTEDPEPELREICAFLGLAFDPAMLHHQELDLTIFKANHLSKARVSSAIDTSMIGRWRRDLNPEQLADFVSVAGEDLARHGYA